MNQDLNLENSGMMQVIVTMVVGLLLSGCGLTSQPVIFNRKAMLDNIGNNIIVPCHQDFVAKTALLEQVVKRFGDAPTEANLQAVQQQWLITAEQWKGCQLFKLGDMMLIHNQIHKWPTNTKFINKFIVEQDVIDEAFVESSGSTSKGLPAIEYLIFNPKLNNAAILSLFTTETTGPKRMDYLLALAENLNTKARDLLNFWSPEGENYVETFINADMEGGELNGSINRLANQMVARLETAANSQLNRPLKGSYGTPQPQAAEAWRSQTSVELLTKNIEAFQETFSGAGGTGFDDYLDFLEAQYNNKPLSDQINSQAETALAALKAIDQPLHIAVVNNPAPVQLAYDEVKKLLVLIKVDMANTMGVIITFNDNDGD